MKILTIDLETAPNVAHTWGLWEQNIGLNQLLTPGYILCVGAKWYDQPEPMFFKGPNMLRGVHKALEQADVVVGFNHVGFDLKWLNSEFAQAGMVPPSPYKNVDLLRVVKANFRLPSNKLQYVSSVLLDDAKVNTGGHQLWIDVMANKRDAWAKMREYCLQDVLLTERLYDRLKPWIKLPNPALYGDAMPGQITCPGCGSNDMRKRGLAFTQLSAYQRYRCEECGRYAQGKNRLGGVDAR